MAATWVPGAQGSGFDVDNLPYGVVRPPGGDARPAVRVGAHALDLRALGRAGALPEAAGAFEAPDLNAFLAPGPPAWSAVRAPPRALLPHPAQRPPPPAPPAPRPAAAPPPRPGGGHLRLYSP